MSSKKVLKRIRIKRRVRANAKGTAEKPRFSVFRSNKEIYAQLIDDVKGVTLASSSSVKEKKGSKLEKAASVGKSIAEVASKSGVSSVYFDRNGYLYHGRVKALADAAREAGLKF